LKNSNKHGEQKNYRGVLILGVEIIHKIMVQDWVGILSLWLFHQVQVKNWPSLLFQHRVRSTTLTSI